MGKNFTVFCCCHGASRVAWTADSTADSTATSLKDNHVFRLYYSKLRISPVENSKDEGDISSVMGFSGFGE